MFNRTSNRPATLPGEMTGREEFRIIAPLLQALFEIAREAGRNECIGWLARRKAAGDLLATHACLLPARVSASSAQAQPLDLDQCSRTLRTLGLVPAGIWHSHGSHAVFHSGTDIDTLARCLPAMASPGMRCGAPPVLTPMVLSVDEAQMPGPAGQTIVHTLLGPSLGAGRQRVSWSFVTTDFINPDEPPLVTQRPDPNRAEAMQLELRAGGVGITLGLPEGSELQTRLSPATGYRSAKLYSLVVNNRAEKFAESFAFHEIDGRILTSGAEACSIVEVDGAADSDHSVFDIHGRAIRGRCACTGNPVVKLGAPALPDPNAVPNN